MCYVHNQWYDISCATLYYNAKCDHLFNIEWYMSGRKRPFHSLKQSPTSGISASMTKAIIESIHFVGRSSRIVCM